MISSPTLNQPFPVPPESGQVIEVAPGILWIRLAMPFRLDHINIYLLADDQGWTVLDTGLGNAPTIEAWEILLQGPLRGMHFSRLIVTHMHPDHIGLAGWLCRRFDMPLWTSMTTWLGCLNISLGPGELDTPHFREFYLRHGLDEATTASVATQGHRYLKMVTALPPTFRRLVAGDRIRIGRRNFEVMTGDGHAPEQIMLHCAEEGVFFASDQVLAKITPNVSTWTVEPDGNPLGLYLRSLRQLQEVTAPDVLVLPGHQLPFVGLHHRARELIAHHATRCAMIVDAVKDSPKALASLVPIIFPRLLDPHQLGFAFSETHAHVNLLVEEGALRWEAGPSAVMTVAKA
jgi:glyoxylase-like metal-dependent hydrolase (beta-lactamase superfamily II)